jgi:uncharacterized protein (TIGR03086 family)
MAELIELFNRATQEFDDRVRAVRPDQWGNPTPDTEWDVRTLVNHLIVEQLWVPETMAGKTVEEVGDRFEGDHAGDDPIATWQQAVAESRATFAQPDALDTIVHHTGREAPARDYCREMTADAIVHSWDLAKGIGADDRLDPELVEFEYEGFESVRDQLASTGLFADQIDVPDDADLQTRLLAIVGRRADWSAP